MAPIWLLTACFLLGVDFVTSAKSIVYKLTQLPPDMTCIHTLPNQSKCLINDGDRRHLFKEAQTVCQFYHASLPTIRSAEEQQFVAEYHFNQSDSGLWLGAYYDNATSVYRWIDGTAFNYTNWAPGQPLQGESCVRLAGGMTKSPWWYAVPCEQFNGFICEKTIRMVDLGREALVEPKDSEHEKIKKVVSELKKNLQQLELALAEYEPKTTGKP